MNVNTHSDAGSEQIGIDKLVSQIRGDVIPDTVYIEKSAEGGSMFYDNAVYDLSAEEIEQLIAALPDVHFEVVPEGDSRLQDSQAQKLAAKVVFEARRRLKKA